MKGAILFGMLATLTGCGSTPHAESCDEQLAEFDTETVVDGCLVMGVNAETNATSFLGSGGICNQCGRDVRLNWRNTWKLDAGKAWRSDGTIVEDAEWLRPQLAFYDVESNTVGVQHCGVTGEPSFNTSEEHSLTLAAGEALFFEVDAPLERAFGFYTREYLDRLYTASTDTLLITWPTASRHKFNNLPQLHCGNLGSLPTQVRPGFDPSQDVEGVFTETKSNLPLGPPDAGQTNP